MSECCNCTTTWSCEETDLVFKVWYNFLAHYPSSPGSDWTWTYTVGVPNNGQYKIISVSSGAKSSISSGPTSSCDCINTSSGSVVSENPQGEEEVELGYFSPTYQGYWSRSSGGKVQTIYGYAEWRADRYSVRKKKTVNYTNNHKCGSGCPGGTGNWTWDDIESIEGGWETMEPY
jgi:hypothetical protein